MPSYIYIAKTKKGVTEHGHAEAKNKAQLAALLREKGLILTFSELAGKKSTIEKYLNLKKIVRKLNRVSLEDKMIFSRHLSIMLKSGLPLSRSLKVLARQTDNPKFKKAIAKIEESVRRGKSFSESLADYPKIFDSLYINMIKVGEEGGSLTKTLNILADQMKKDHQLISRVKGAMMYPAVIVVAMVGIGILMMIMVVPKITDTFKELDIELPITTRIVIGLSDFLKNQWFFALIIIAGALFLTHLLLKNHRVRKGLHKVFLHLPIFGSLTKKINAARFARTTSSLIKSGVGLVRTLQIVAGTLGNMHFQESLNSAAGEVKKGKELSASLAKNTQLYPPMVIQMIKVGEETGSIASILINLADFYEEEIDNTTKALSSVLEPVIMVVIGAAVGFFAVSMIQPMYSMMGGI